MADNIGASFSRVKGGDPRDRRATARHSEGLVPIKIGTITAVNSDHLLVQPVNENDIIRVDRFPFGTSVPTLPPYVVGNLIVCMFLETPRVADYPWIDMNLQGRNPVQFYVQPWNLNIPMQTLAMNPRSCSISLPVSDTFTDTNGVTLDLHYMDSGCGWSMFSGTITNGQIQSNNLQIDETGTFRAWCQTDDTIHGVQTDWVVGQPASQIDLEMMARVIDSANYWRCRCTAAASGASNQQLIERTAGGNTVRATTTATIAFNANMTMKFNDDVGAVSGAMQFDGSVGATFTLSFTSSTHQSAGTGNGFGHVYSGAITNKTTLNTFTAAATV